ncbi:EndoU domain-containing protein, partial [Gilliamella sp. Bif1-4]|uniref:EndoU domain-containing protein n=1 Tax=Gilliamella sp. Bif1-4 TaxID=3120233 RepID=UPI000B1C4C3F
GNDANIVAGQVKGNRVVADIGHDLNIESKQDSDEFHSKSTSTSVGGSFSYGGSSSINASASKTKMDSNWQSVTDQSGIFAGSGGYDIKVGNNTDLKGAVISSEAKDKSQNRLDTGTISFSDIENKADYQVSSSSAGVSSSGMPSMPTSRNKNESEHSTTHSAVSEGTIIIRNKDTQKQDINELSRDTEQANNELKHIFNKQKEQDIIDQTHLVSEIGGETLTMLNHIDRIKAESKAKEAVEKEQEKAADKGIVLTDKQQQKIYEDAYKESMNQGMSAMGSDTRQGIDMAVSIINGLISGDMTGAAAGALAPKIATIIKQQTEGSTVANTVSHAILGAVVAELQGNSALVGGLGAAASERGAEVIIGILYPGKTVAELSQEERQQISALSQLATGLAIAAAGGDIQDVNTGVAAGKNAVENNGLSWADGGFGGDFIGLSPETGANYEGILHASAAGYLTQEETEEALERLITGKDMPNGSDYVELWMRAPEQIGAFLPGPISAAMAALAMADKSLTDTDKADLISVLNKATGDYLTGADTESLLELNTALSRFGAKSTNKQFQQFIKEKVENNVATSQKGNKSSKFGEHAKNEQEIKTGKQTTETANKAGEYLEDFKPSSTPAELVQQQAGKGSQVSINTEHILNGEIKTYKNGKKVGTGGHYLKDPNIRVDRWTGAADVNGVKTGYISVRDPATGKWYKKQAETTFFPEHWSKRQTEMEIESAFRNSKPHADPLKKEMWQGTSSSGVKMEGYYKKPNGTGATAWPVYQGAKK